MESSFLRFPSALEV